MSVYFLLVTIFLFGAPIVVFGQTTPSTKCVAEGKFEIEDGTCQNYYICIYDGAKYIRYDVKCQGSTVFNLDTCVSSNLYTCTQTTLTPPTTTEAICVAPGRFEIKDPKCQKYYFCFWDGAKYTRWNLSCPNSLRFNPALGKCVAPNNYTCPAQ